MPVAGIYFHTKEQRKEETKVFILSFVSSFLRIKIETSHVKFLLGQFVHHLIQRIDGKNVEQAQHLIASIAQAVRGVAGDEDE